MVFMEAKMFWAACPLTEMVPDRMSGVPVVKGTRMPADDVVENYNSGSPVEEIAENFGLKANDIRSLLAYHRAHSRKPALTS